MKEIRCAGCRKHLGRTLATDTPKIWCTELSCYVFPAAMANEARDDYIRFLHVRREATAAELAAHFRLTNARIHQILNA